MATSGLEIGTPGLREKNLNLQSHGGDLISGIWELFFRNKAPQNPPP